MLQSIVHAILTIFLTVVTFVLNIVLIPLTLLLDALFPGIDTFFAYFDNLFNNYLAPGIRFAREVLLNLTCLDRNLIGILLMIPLTYFGFTMANLSIRFLISVVKLWKKGEMN